MSYNPARRTGFTRVNRQIGTTTGALIDVQAATYQAITLGPRHTCGAVAIQNRSFEGLAASFGTSGVAIATFSEPSILISPRSPFVGEFSGRTTIYDPGYSKAGFTGTFVPEIDLIFWRELPPFLATRSDSHMAWSLANTQSAFFPTGGRKEIRLFLANIGGVTSSTTIKLGYYDPLAGFQAASLRTYGVALVPSGSTYVACFGPNTATPGTPLVGENGTTPGLITVAEGAATTTLVKIEAID